MRIIAQKTLFQFWTLHPETETSLRRWRDITKLAKWHSPTDVMKSFGSADVIDGKRVGFEVHGGNFRLIAAFDFTRQIAFIKFLGTHKEYDAIDAATVSLF